MNHRDKNEHKFKHKVISETRMFIIYTFFLWIMFGIFNIYQRLLLNDFSNRTIHYGYSLFEAVILAKIIVVGKVLPLSKRWEKLPLIFIVIYKTCIFSLFVIAFMLFENFVTGYLHGHTLAETYYEITTLKINIILAKIFIMFIIFVQFFSFLELSRMLGKDELYRIFFTRKQA